MAKSLILAVEDLTFGGWRPKPKRAGVSVVYETTQGELHDEDRVLAFPRWQGFRRRFDVDLNGRTCKVVFRDREIVTMDGALAFPGSLAFSFQVTDARTVVREGITDAEPMIRERLMANVRPWAALYRHDQPRTAEAAINRNLSDPARAGLTFDDLGLRIYDCQVRLDLDPKILTPMAAITVQDAAASIATDMESLLRRMAAQGADASQIAAARQQYEATKFAQGSERIRLVAEVVSGFARLGLVKPHQINDVLQALTAGQSPGIPAQPAIQASAWQGPTAEATVVPPDSIPSQAGAPSSQTRLPDGGGWDDAPVGHHPVGTPAPPPAAPDYARPPAGAGQQAAGILVQPIYFVLDGSAATAAYHHALVAGLQELWTTLRADAASAHLRLAVVVASDSAAPTARLVDLVATPAPPVWNPVGAFALGPALDATRAAIADGTPALGPGVSALDPLIVIVSGSAADSAGVSSRIRLLDPAIRPRGLEIVAYALDPARHGWARDFATLPALAFSSEAGTTIDAVRSALRALAQDLASIARAAAFGSRVPKFTTPDGFRLG